MPLLPLLFEKLLGAPLDSAPWGTPALRATVRQCGSDNPQDEDSATGLDVTVALASPPPAESGLFEVGIPLGGPPVSLRLLGVRDTSQDVSHIDAVADLCDDEDADESVVLLALPSDWFPRRLLRAAWDRKVLRLDETEPEVDPDIQEDEDAEEAEECEDGRRQQARRGGAAWHAWFEQWGEVRRLEISAHAGAIAHSGEREAESDNVLIAVTFAGGAAMCTRCAVALGEGRLLVLQDPARVAFPRAVRATRPEFEEKAEKAWKEHVFFEEEISRIDRALVLEEAADAVPSEFEESYVPLSKLVKRWTESGTLRATSTICAQRRLQEADSSGRSKPPETFRRALWHAAFRVVLQVRPFKDQAEDEEETLTMAVCEHWRKTHGIFTDPDAEELAELAAALREVWRLSRHAEETMRSEAEANARAAEEALLEELEEEEGRAACDRSRKQKKKKQKERQKKREPKATKDSSSKTGLKTGSSSGSTSPASQSTSPPLEDAAQAGGPWETAASTCPKQAMLAEATQALLADVYRGWVARLATKAGGSAEVAKATRNNGATPSGRRLAAAVKRPLVPRPQADDTCGGCSSPPLRRPADLDSILEAVRKSEELKRQHPAPPPQRRLGKVHEQQAESAQLAGDASADAPDAPQVRDGSDVDGESANGAPGHSAKSETVHALDKSSKDESKEAGIDGVSGAVRRLALSRGGSLRSFGARRWASLSSNEASGEHPVSSLGAAADISEEGPDREEIPSSSEGPATPRAPVPRVGQDPECTDDAAEGVRRSHTLSVDTEEVEALLSARCREVVTWGDLGECLLAAPSPTSANHPSAAAFADAGSTAAPGGDDLAPGSPQGPVTRGSKRSARRRRRRSERAKDTASPSDASTASGTSGGNASAGNSSSSASVWGTSGQEFASPAGATPEEVDAGTTSQEPPSWAAFGFTEVYATTPMACNTGDRRRRSVVTCSDLGLELLSSPPATPAGGNVVRTPMAMPQVPPLPGTPASASSAAPAQQSLVQGPSPMAVCPQGVASWPVLRADSWQQHPCSPCSPCAGTRGGASQSIMRTYPVQQGHPVAWAACEASQRSPTAGASPAADACDADPLGLWLRATGLTPSGSEKLGRADLAAQLRAVAPEAYED